jgi:hypothetical protein
MHKMGSLSRLLVLELTMSFRTVLLFFYRDDIAFNAG